MSGYTIDEARRIAINCASSYKSSLEDKQFIKLLSAENPLALADGMKAVLLNQHLA